uniref:Cadherin, EGF LAG seven-pass G-type receptor 3 n=1 Tax=Schistosoma japonicum TaxID=6182 RepID=C1L3X9_SCHJA|nr:cadherin, EGF LAG seven-pass G-type receptor 3 [Schistosoma japonicum]
MSNNHKDTDNILLERKYSITREIYNVDKFLQHHPKSSEKHEKFSQHKILKSCTCSKFANLLSFIFPFYSVLVPFYNLRSFVLDCIAGLTLSIVHIPQGMAYGVLAGVKPINGLYTSFFPALIYFFFGTSRHVSIGTFSVVSLLTADPVDRLISTLDVNNRSLEKYQVFNENQQIDDFRLQIVVTVCILAGLFQLVLGIVRLDVLVVYISEPLLGGFTCASAIHVFSSQLNGLFGIKLNRATGPFRIFYIMKNFIYIVKETNITTLLISLICIFIVWCFKHYINPKVSTKIHFTIPIELIVLVIGTVVSKFYLLNQRYGVSIVGEIPVGLPSPLLPDIRLVPEVLMESVIVSFVSLATTISLIKAYAKKGGYNVGYTQEFCALGLCNVISGFFRCQPASGALARTSVAYGVGMCSQIASLVSCCILLLVITVIGQFLQTVPMCILSSIIVVSLESIFLQITDLRVFYHSSLYDMLIWLVTFLATALIDVPLGLLIGLCFSLLTVLYRTQSTYYYELGQIPNTNIYVDLAKYDEAVKLPKIIILKYGGPLYYANAESFQNWINRLTHIDPYKVVKYRQHIKQQQEQYQRRKQRKLNSNSHNRQHHVVRSQPSFVKNLTKHMKPKKKDCEEFPNDLELVTDVKDRDPTDHLKFIIIDISSWIYLDVVGMRTVTDLVRSYSELNIRILFTVCDPQIQSVLTSGSLTLSQFQHNSFMSIHDAVIYCQGILSTTTTSTNLDTTDHSTEEKELHLPIENLSIDYADSSDPVEDVILDSVTTTKL